MKRRSDSTTVTRVGVLLAPLLLTVIIVSLGLVGCGADNSREAGPLVVVISGDTHGWIVPCGCTSNQSGGLLRRGSYVDAARGEADVIVADCGGAAGGTSPYDRAKFEAILRGEVAMGISAHNIGRAEADLGPETIRRLGGELGVPFVSTNARDATGRPLADALQIVEAAGRRVALVGVLSPGDASGSVKVLSPRQAVLDALAAAEGRYDVVVVLAYLPLDELRELAETLPEADAVVGGPTGQPLPPERIGPVLLTSATNKGKFLVRLDEAGDRGTGYFDASIVELDEKVADDPAQVSNLQRLYETLEQADFAPCDTTFAPNLAAVPAGFEVAGNESCRKCHEEDCDVWADSNHAHAWKSLTEKGAQVDPDCQRCHTTGYGQPGGFESIRRSAARVNVGCESCHGPSAAHVADEKIHTPLYARAKDGCIVCHDRENSPEFDYDKYWDEIRHGEEDVEDDG